MSPAPKNFSGLIELFKCNVTLPLDGIEFIFNSFFIKKLTLSQNLNQRVKVKEVLETS